MICIASYSPSRCSLWSGDSEVQAWIPLRVGPCSGVAYEGCLPRAGGETALCSGSDSRGRDGIQS